MIADQPIPKARGRRRSRRGEGMQAPAIMQRPFAQLTRPYPAVERISDDQIEHIHHASLELLSKTGLDVLHEDARAIMKMAGADVKEGDVRVRFDPDLINGAIETVP